jgi:hypothetical protein
VHLLCQSFTQRGIALILDIRVLHKDSAHGEQAVGHLSQQSVTHWHFRYHLAGIIYRETLGIVVQHFEQRHDFGSSQVKHIVVEKVKVQVDLVEGQNAWGQILSALLNYHRHQVFRNARRKTKVDSTVLRLLSSNLLRGGS